MDICPLQQVIRTATRWYTLSISFLVTCILSSSILSNAVNVSCSNTFLLSEKKKLFCVSVLSVFLYFACTWFEVKKFVKYFNYNYSIKLKKIFYFALQKCSLTNDVSLFFVSCFYSVWSLPDIRVQTCCVVIVSVSVSVSVIYSFLIKTEINVKKITMAILLKIEFLQSQIG